MPAMDPDPFLGYPPNPPGGGLRRRDAQNTRNRRFVKQLISGDQRTMRDPIEKRPYELLPPEMRPKYTTRRDLRLMAKAHREGWVVGVPPERYAEWDQDLAEILRNCEDTALLCNVAKVLNAAEKLRTDLFRARVSALL